jgi:hypothetical protein
MYLFTKSDAYFFFNFTFIEIDMLVVLINMEHRLNIFDSSFLFFIFVHDKTLNINLTVAMNFIYVLSYNQIKKYWV